MTEGWHLVTSEYVPAIGGIARFTQVLARTLASSGAAVHVWTVAGGKSEPGVRVHALPDRFGRGTRRALGAAMSESPRDTFLVQYVPNTFGRRGANLSFCAWLGARMRRGIDIRPVFHEPFFYFGLQSPARNGLAIVHRLMAAALLSSARTVYVASSSWRRLLAPYAFGRAVEWIPLPVSVGEPPAPASGAVARIRQSRESIVGHVSGYAAELRPHLREAILSVLRHAPDADVLCIGRGSREFASTISDPRVHPTGELAEEELAAHVAACDLMIAPFDEGLTARRTSVLIALASGVPVLSTDGRHTEPVWRESSGVALAPAGDPQAFALACARLLSSPADRRGLAARGRALYDECFSPAALLSALNRVPVEHGHAAAHFPGR